MNSRGLLLFISYCLKNFGGAQGLQKPAFRATNADAAILVANQFHLLPEYKLAFCVIKKGGGTSFKALFHNISQQVRSDVTHEEVEQILADKSWHKGVFVRDPRTRFASAWQSKCSANEKQFYHCRQQFGVDSLSFEEAVARLDEWNQQQGEHSQRQWDGHFQRQADYCTGLDRTIQHYDTVEELTSETAHEKVAEMLGKVGVETKNLAILDESFPKNTPDGMRQFHNDHQTSVEAELETYYPKEKPWLAEVVNRTYNEDYDLLAIARAGQS